MGDLDRGSGCRDTAGGQGSKVVGVAGLESTKLSSSVKVIFVMDSSILSHIGGRIPVI
jgi:hypothetical protein